MKRLEYLRLSAVLPRLGLGRSNPAMVLKPPKVTQRPTLPFEDSEIERILKAAEHSLSDMGHVRSEGARDGLAAAYSGLRMQDAACLERARLKNGKLFLYTQKNRYPRVMSVAADGRDCVERRCRNGAPGYFSGTAGANARRRSRAGTACSESFSRRQIQRSRRASTSFSSHVRRVPAAQWR